MNENDWVANVCHSRSGVRVQATPHLWMCESLVTTVTEHSFSQFLSTSSGFSNAREDILQDDKPGAHTHDK